MSKKKNKETGDVYYANKIGSSTIRKIIAASDDEAIQKADELFGKDNYHLGKLPKARSKEEQRADDRAYERAAEKVLGPIGREAVQFLNETKRYM